MDLQYVILEHTIDGVRHFDLLLEVEGQERLRTLQLERWPLNAGESCKFSELPPHRRIYLTYEGEISGGRGRVRRVESGSWRRQGDDLVLAPTGLPARCLDFQANAVFRR
jgi:hypothetical protein